MMNIPAGHFITSRSQRTEPTLCDNVKAHGHELPSTNHRDLKCKQIHLDFPCEVVHTSQVQLY